MKSSRCSPTAWEVYGSRALYVVPHELIANADTVVALGEYSGTYKATGKSFRAPFVHVWKFSGDRVASFRQHTDTAVIQRALR